MGPQGKAGEVPGGGPVGPSGGGSVGPSGLGGKKLCSLYNVLIFISD